MHLFRELLLRKRNKPRPERMSLGKLSLGSDTQVQSGKPRRFFRFVVKILQPEVDVYKTFIVRIRSRDLQWLPDVDISNYTRHDHSNFNHSRFCFLQASQSQITQLGLTPASYVPHSSTVAVGRHVYTLCYDKEAMCLRFTSIHIRTTDYSLLPPLISPNRLYPKILSTRGKIYLLGGLVSPSRIGPHTLFNELQSLASQPQPFGEVFDPQTKSWSALKQPPKATKLVKRSKMFVTSLGEFEAKLLVYDYEASRPTFYIYDIVAEKWLTCHPNPSFSRVFQPRFIFGEEVLNTYDDNIYWLDERKGDIYAFDWKAMKIYYGPIVGMEHISFLKALKDCSLAVTLHHLWEDFFCLCWSEVIRGRGNSSSGTTKSHFTFLRVIKGPYPNKLTAFVLGCLMNSDGFYYRMFDAICI